MSLSHKACYLLGWLRILVWRIKESCKCWRICWSICYFIYLWSYIVSSFSFSWLALFLTFLQTSSAYLTFLHNIFSHWCWSLHKVYFFLMNNNFSWLINLKSPNFILLYVIYISTWIHIGIIIEIHDQIFNYQLIIFY